MWQVFFYLISDAQSLGLKKHVQLLADIICISFTLLHMDSVRGAFLLTIYKALLPKGACGSAGWVSNTTHYDCCHYRRRQECNPFGHPADQGNENMVLPLLFGIGRLLLNKPNCDEYLKERQDRQTIG